MAARGDLPTLTEERAHQISFLPTAPPIEALEIFFPNDARMRIAVSMVARALPLLDALLSR